MSECFRCKRPINWEAIEWNYFTVVGYRSRIHICTCGHQQSRHEPFSKAAKEFWMDFKNWVTGDNERA